MPFVCHGCAHHVQANHRVMHAAAGPATTSEPATAAPELPACCELHDGTAVVRADNPSFEELRGTVLYNRGVAGIKAGDTHFKRELEFKSGGKVVGTMLVTSLWAALRAAGGMHLVSVAAAATRKSSRV